jgi:hypothetical protein
MNTKSMFVLCLLAVMLFACQSASQPGEETNDVVAAPTVQVSDQDQPLQAVPVVKEDAAVKKFKSYLTSKSTTSWKIAYDMTASAAGTTTSGKMMQYMKGSQFRTDFTSAGIESQTYVADDQYTTCMKQGTSWNCYKSDMTDNTKEMESDIAKDNSKYTITSDGTKMVAGVNTECYKIISLEPKMTSKYCIAADGAPLYVKTELPQAISELTATSYSKSVSEADFVPPAAAKDLKTLGSTGSIVAPTEDADPCAACEQIPADYRADCLASCSG